MLNKGGMLNDEIHLPCLLTSVGDQNALVPSSLGD